MLDAPCHLAIVGQNLYVVGMTWKESSFKTVKIAGKNDARALIEGDEDSGARACFAVSASSDRKSASYGLAPLPTVIDRKRVKGLHSLAACLAAQSEDGLYVLRITPVNDTEIKDAQKNAIVPAAAPVYWVVGISGGVVIPRTDVIYADADEMQPNLSMLRVFAPDLPVFVEDGIDGVMFHDQESWKLPSSMPGSGSTAVFVVGSGPAGASLRGMPDAVKIGAGAALLLALGGGGYYGWSAYQASLVVQAPDPAVQALQQRQAYEARLQEMHAQFSSSALDARWSHLWAALEVARTAGAAGGYSLSSFACNMQDCRVSFAAVAGLVQMPSAVLQRFTGVAPGVSIHGADGPNMLLKWTPPASGGANEPGRIDQAQAWAASRPARSEFDSNITAITRPTMQALNPSFRIASSVGQTQGRASGLAAVGVLSQLDATGVDGVSLQVLSIPLQIDVLALQGWAQSLAIAMSGRAAALEVQFSPEGVAQPATVQVVSVVRP